MGAMCCSNRIQDQQEDDEALTKRRIQTKRPDSIQFDQMSQSIPLSSEVKDSDEEKEIKCNKEIQIDDLELPDCNQIKFTPKFKNDVTKFVFNNINNCDFAKHRAKVQPKRERDKSVPIKMFRSNTASNLDLECLSKQDELIEDFK